MKAAVITGLEQLEILDFSRPHHATPGMVVVEVARTGICGSDVTAFQSGRPYLPFLSGHEWGGRIVSVGAGVTDLAEGDRVMAASTAACGRCLMCRAGHFEYCDSSRSAFGGDPRMPSHGGYAERIMFPAEAVTAIRTT